MQNTFMPDTLTAVTQYRFVFLGAGAVGGSLAARLHLAGHRVQIIARGEHGRAIQNHGLTLQQPGESVTLPIPCVEKPADVAWNEKDIVLIATKLQDAASALSDLHDAAGPQVPVICAQNGIHGERWAAQLFQTVLSTLVWVPASHLEAGVVQLFSTGSLGVLDTGPHQGDADQSISRSIVTAWQRAGFDAVVRNDIAAWKKAKWITNLGSAAHALVRDHWESVAEAAQEEGDAVLRAAGESFISIQELLQRCAKVQFGQIDGKARAGGSTWQSFQRGTPMESPWLEGAMAELAKQHGIPVPVNTALAQAAKCRRRIYARDVLSDQA